MHFGIHEVAKTGSDRISQLDVVANNLANAATPGFKGAHWYTQASGKEAEKTNSSFYSSSILADFSQGILQHTGNPLDVAIQGEGFFTVQTSAGPAYTRKGNFMVNSKRQLVTQSGEQVLGRRGPMTIGGNNVTIDNQGIVSVDGAVVDRFAIMRFDAPTKLNSRGDGFYADPGTAGAKVMDQPDLSPRQLELSNVNAMREMVDMINIQRSFESYQKVIQTIADNDKLSTSRVGKLI